LCRQEKESASKKQRHLAKKNLSGVSEGGATLFTPSGGGKKTNLDMKRKRGLHPEHVPETEDSA